MHPIGEPPLFARHGIRLRASSRSPIVNRKSHMKTFLLLATLITVAALPLKADDVKIVSSRGTVSTYGPDRLVLRGTAGEETYTYGSGVTYKTSSGVVIPESEYRTRFVAGAPVRVHYVTEGERRVVKRVVLRDRGDKDDDDDDN